jgi:hypothetical protein
VKAWSTIFSGICQFIRILSLDILAGVFCGYTFARIVLDCDCPAAAPIVLCGTVWLIYTLDHLLDARSRKEQSARPAYRWHWKHRKILWPLLMVAATGTVAIGLVCLPLRVIVFGCITASLVILYTLAHQGMPGLRARYIFKEGWISVIYTAGVWGVPLLYYGEVPNVSIFVTVIIYWLLVLINVMIYSLHEYQTDLKESQTTLATLYGPTVARHLLRLLMLCVLTLITVAFLLVDDAGLEKAYVILLGMAGGLGLILGFPEFFHQYARYGILADGLFLLPGLLYWIV